ncbi:MAG TPA: hypothetical protein VFM45_05355 [Anaeromyxobacteraceae bacterium]|nr:hypothetical protein [Anaeromyxobacteraceae bacterium]
MAQENPVATGGASGAGKGSEASGAPSGGTGKLGRAMAWMFVLSILLFWLPVLGMFIAGLVGGKKAGGVGTAVAAVLLPAAIVGGVMFLMTAALLGMPILGAIAGLGAGALVVANVVPLLLGAIIGGVLA